MRFLQVKSLFHLFVSGHQMNQQNSQSGCWTGRQAAGHLLGLGQSAPVRSLTKVKLTRCVGKGETDNEFQSISQKKLSWITWNICIFPAIFQIFFTKFRKGCSLKKIKKIRKNPKNQKKNLKNPKNKKKIKKEIKKSEKITKIKKFF